MTEPTDSTTQAASPLAPQTKRVSKLETVRRLSDSAPPPVRLWATMELQRQLSDLSAQVLDLGQMLSNWSTALTDLSSAHQVQMLDLAVLLEPIEPALAQIHQKQQQQDERLAKQDQRLANLETLMSRVMAALSPQQQKDGRQTQPRLALSRKQRLFLE